MRVRHLYLSPGHAYFGRHGQPAADFPIQEVPQVHCVAGRGLQGDRFFDFKTNYKGQVTFFAWEEYDRLRALFGVTDRAPSVFRRNVITEGADLLGWIGEEFTVQGVRFHGMAECSPCHWMDEAFYPGTEEALHGRGGLRARVLSDGFMNAEP